MVSLLKRTDSVWTTKRILSQSAAHPLHLRSRDELMFVSVSAQSLWMDRKWVFDNTTPGSSKSGSSFNWDLDLPDGHNLLDDCYFHLIDWIRRLIWSAYAAPGEGSDVLKPGTLGQISGGFRYWTAWLVDHHIDWPCEINEDVIRLYINDLKCLADGDFENEQISENVARTRLTPFVILWRQRFELMKVGISPMPQPPFGRAGAYAIAKEIGATAKGRYKALPDEVAVSVLNSAMTMLGTPADDVIALVNACEEAYKLGLAPDNVRSGVSKVASKMQSDVARSWRFSEIDGKAWREPLEINNSDQWRIKAIENKLKPYIAEKQAAWDRVDPASSRIPTLPFIGTTAKKAYVDLKFLANALDLEAGEWRLLANHPKLRQIVTNAALEQDLLPPIKLRAITQLRQLVLHIRSAAQVVIQATTSMRISEICGLQAGVDPSSGLPTSVSVRDSLSGLAEVFVISTNIAKTEETPRSVEWTLGYRPKGSTSLPPAVRAILVLDRLLSPYRDLLGRKDLFVSLYTPNALPKTKAGVRPILAINLLINAREFIAEWVDLSSLPDDASRGILKNELVPYRESHGRCIATHQWRKTFGHFATSVDRRLLPDLQMHFHHVSSAMTDGAYTGNPILERDMNDVRYQKMALLSLEIAEGRTSIAGRFGEELEIKIKAELGPRTEGVEQEEAYREAFVYVEESGLSQLFFDPHGICGARSASQMACHNEAGTVEVARWTNKLSPNYETRSPSLCVGCESFAIAKWHLPFWEQRYIECAAEILHLEIKGLTGNQFENAAALTRARATQALAICRKLGSDPHDLEARLELKVEELNAS